MANSFAFIVMLAAANDLMRRPSTGAANSTSSCEAVSPAAQCAKQPLGAVVLANVLPAAAVKLLVPFALHRLPFAALLVGVCAAQAASYLLVASSASIPWTLAGVGFAALSSGLGDVCFLASIISAWSSGTGASGLLGSLAYAALTEPRLGGLTPQQALLSMLVVPVLLFCTCALMGWRMNAHSSAASNYCCSQPPPPFTRPRCGGRARVSCPAWSARKRPSHLARPPPDRRRRRRRAAGRQVGARRADGRRRPARNRRDFGLSPAAAYCWIQATYCCGAFVSRSGAHLLRLPAVFLALFPLYEFLNAGFFFAEATRHFLPHIGVVFALDAVGGASDDNTYFRIHTEVPPARREFSLAIATLSDAVGIALSGVATLPLQTAVCRSLAKVS
ncbi:Battenin [Aphelenchoides fujianensis]|nr:Battenin [Aphelenchoides fujianensis]